MGNLSYFYDKNYYAGNQTNVKDMLLPYLVPGLGRATRVASYIGATNQYFSDKNNYYIPSSEELYLLPSQLITAINQTAGLQQAQKEQANQTFEISLDASTPQDSSDKFSQIRYLDPG